MDIWVRLARYSVIESDRLFLRPFLFTDIPDFQEIMSNKENTIFIFPSQDSVHHELLAVHTFMKNPLGVWVIHHKEHNRMIGLIRFEKIDTRDKVAELGYFLNKRYWNKRYMTEAVELVSELTFKNIGFKEIRIITHKENKASQAVAKNSGYTYFKQFRGSDRYTHKTKDYLIFRRLKGK